MWDRAGRAIWLRYTTFSPRQGPQRATLWASLFESNGRPPRFAGKAIHPIEAYAAREESISIADAELTPARAAGQIQIPDHRLRWDIAFEPTSPPRARMPALVERMPTPTKAHPVFFDAPAEGTITIDGDEIDFAGRSLLTHLHGTKRVDALTWTAGCSPPGDRASVEITSVRPKAKAAGLGLPALTTIALDTAGREAVMRTELADAVGNRMVSPRPGLAIARGRGARSHVIARAHADLSTFTGYAYRDPGDGHDVFVAQSDVASIVVEEYERATPVSVWRPVAQTRFAHAALEHHDLAPVEGVPTIGWDETHLPSPSGSSSSRTSKDADHVPWPEVRSIVALGLTYRDHIRETGGDPNAPDASVVFAKHPRTFLVDGERVEIPSSRALVEALAAIEPDIGRAIEQRYGFLPALMDYEVEIGIVVLGDADYGFFVANDLTARSCQVLGEGMPAPLDYWAVSKSFPGFCPVGATVWRPDTRVIPEVEIVTRVNGKVRQRASTRELVFDLPRILDLAAQHLGRPLARGDAILTGTPSGVALQVPAWKKRLGDALFDRFGKLDRAITMAVDNGRFLGEGDVVEVSGGPLGSRAIRLSGADA